MPRPRLFRRATREVAITPINQTVTWGSARGSSQDKYVQLTEIDRWRAVPFTMAPAPEHGRVMEQVERLTKSLDGAIDEGSDKSLDRLIISWVGSWIATVESEFDDHCAVIGVHRGQARQLLTEAQVKADHEREKHEHVRQDYAASRSRLTGEAPAPWAAPAADGEAAASAEPAAAPPPTRHDWSEPHLVAGRGWLGLALGAVLIVIGAMADTIAFHNVLELVLRTESETVAWIMAVGTTSMALVSAAVLGVSRAIRRRGRYLPPRYRPSRLPMVTSAVVWIGLGLAMFLIRWQNTGDTSGLLGTGTTAGPAHSAVWQALFFLAIYLVSGACTIFEAERLYNPEFAAFKRLRKQYSQQAKVVAKADAERDRAQSVLEQHEAELERQERLRDHAIADRKALGAEAANYARLLMASMMGDPAKTGVTETGPLPAAIATALSSAPGAGAAAVPGFGAPPASDLSTGLT